MSQLNNKNINRMFAMNFKYIKQVFISLALLSYMAFAGAVETITYFHNDALGSPVAATDESGNVLWREAYKPYGSRIRKEDNGTNDTWYTGKQEDKDTGLSYFGARWYDPVIGRFMGIDPVGFKEGNIHSFNRYAYANNNPYKFVDPDGNTAKLIFDYGRGVYIGTSALLRLVKLTPHIIAFGGTVYGLTHSNNYLSESGDESNKNTIDSNRKEKQREKRRKRREIKSRGKNGNGQNQSGSGFRDRENSNKGPKGERNKGPNRKNNRERNKGIDEEHSITPKGTPSFH